MKLPAYPRTKPSGVEWLGDVPEHWDVKPCRTIVRERTAKNDDGKCEDYLSLLANVGVIPYEEKGDIGNKKPLDLTKCKMVKRGDYVINSMNYGIGSYGISAYDGVCSSVYIVLTPRPEIVESRFAFRTFENKEFQMLAQSFGNGILEHRCAINWDILKGIGVAIPPLDEQRAIAALLDRETGRVDRLVAKKRELIERLKEKRTALISRTVTRGLPPAAARAAGLPENSPLKPSSLDWLGDIPNHWEIKAIKWESPVKRGASPRPIDDEKFFDDEGEYAWVRIADVTAAGPFLEKTEQRMSPLGSSLSVKLKPGALFLSIAGTVGKPCITTIKCCIHDGFVYFPSWKGDTKFLFYIFASGEPYKGLGKMGTQLNLNTDTVGSIKIGLPPLPEQAAIAAYLDVETAKLDALVGKVEEAVERLQEYRTALLTAAVTGKIDVRNTPSTR